ncbi:MULTISPECIES: dTDP-glucose 4,6-dehydratase [Priestia]|uniref:dTDP-glucose 4,6-dehydratase n=1 Tax=Priestia TaxID=2800373 RepID=UPI00345A3B1F
MNLLITGGAGFIGLNFVHYLLKNTSYHITLIDALTYASHPLEILRLQDNDAFRFIQADITSLHELSAAFDKEYDAIIHFAAESHVDNSIQNANLFIETNITGTYHLLTELKKGNAKKMIYVSTDEVYGSLQPGQQPFTENAPLAPNNPYAATKASGDLLVRSYFQTFNLPLITTRCSNNFGPFQHKEKFIPTIIHHAFHNKKIPIYGDGKQIRDWLFVRDHCEAIMLVMNKGRVGEVYNIGGENEYTNLEVVNEILTRIKKPKSLISFIADRKGHDRRYAINSSKLQNELGWKQATSFTKGLDLVINWYSIYLKRVGL